MTERIDPLRKLQSIQARYEELQRLMAQPESLEDLARLQELAREASSLEELATKSREYQATTRALEETHALLEEEQDSELRELAGKEMVQLQERLELQWQALKLSLLPKDPQDEKDVIVEIRAGAGGDEAGLFAADLFRMYARYAESQRWHTEVLSSSESGIGGFKEIICEVRGRGAYSRLKYESGVHRVQRVPVTEAGGRIHTSTATVAVLAEADEVEVAIDPEELRIDIFHSSGHGGQNVQKVATAVRITHLPTGIVVTCQDERSQLKNRMKAMAVLRARLLAQEQQRQSQEIAHARRSQVGSGDRAEKIRTYNFPQDRVTDHRVGLTLRNLPAVLAGDLDSLIDAVATTEQAKRLEAVLV